MNEMKRIVVQSSKMGNLVIKLISKQKARELIIENHYSHKMGANHGLFNYGIFREGAESENECLGVAVYGYMMHPKAKHFTHPNPKAMMLELNRMWISDELGKNAETILISRSLKLLKLDCPNCVAVQSFADGRLGCGTIYKAANFRFFGSHKTAFYKNKRTGEINHHMNLTRMDSKSMYLRNNIAYLLGDLEAFEVDTYRYIFP
ncbi:Mom family adenine methylcarbamoylation protein, partial [Ornithobacterium rhinotracheale]